MAFLFLHLGPLISIHNSTAQILYFCCHRGHVTAQRTSICLLPVHSCIQHKSVNLQSSPLPCSLLPISLSSFCPIPGHDHWSSSTILYHHPEALVPLRNYSLSPSVYVIPLFSPHAKPISRCTLSKKPWHSGIESEMKRI